MTTAVHWSKVAINRVVLIVVGLPSDMLTENVVGSGNNTPRFWRKRAFILVTIFATLAFVLLSYPSVTVASEGSTWSTMKSGTTSIIRDIWGTSSSNVYVVGYNGTILHYDGTSWVPMVSGTENNLTSIWGNSGSDVFAVGYTGIILHYDGSGWNPMASSTKNHLTRIWGHSGSDVFVIGNSGTILHYDGTAWSPMTSGTTSPLNGVWGHSGANVFAVGNSGVILHYDGSSWAPMTSGTTNTLVDVWGSSVNDVFAVGISGTILHYDGIGWNPMSSGTVQHLYGVWGSSSIDVFAAGESGTIVHYDGTGWRPMDSGTKEIMGALWGSSATDVFAVGFNGMILHFASDHTAIPSPAPEEVVLSGTWNGAEMSIPVELHKGDRIIGDMSIARYNMWARITAPSGILVESNKVTSAHVDYVSETSGTLFFTFVHLYGLGSPLYNVTYTIYPSTGSTTIPPPSPPPPTAPPVTTSPLDGGDDAGVDSPMWGWIIVGFIVLGILFAFVAARDRVRRKRYYDEDYEVRGVPSGERHVYHHFPRRCKRCGGTGKVKRPMMPIQRGGLGMKEQYDDCPVCRGTGVVS